MGSLRTLRQRNIIDRRNVRLDCRDVHMMTIEWSELNRRFALFYGTISKKFFLYLEVPEYTVENPFPPRKFPDLIWVACYDPKFPDYKLDSPKGEAILYIQFSKGSPKHFAFHYICNCRAKSTLLISSLRMALASLPVS